MPADLYGMMREKLSNAPPRQMPQLPQIPRRPVPPVQGHAPVLPTQAHVAVGAPPVPPKAPGGVVGVPRGAQDTVYADPSNYRFGRSMAGENTAALEHAGKAHEEKAPKGPVSSATPKADPKVQVDPSLHQGEQPAQQARPTAPPPVPPNSAASMGTAYPAAQQPAPTPLQYHGDFAGQAAPAQAAPAQAAPAQAAPAQAPAQAAPTQAAPTQPGTWGNWVNSGMDAVRGGAANAQGRAATGWEAVTPENKATLQNAANAAKTWGKRGLTGGLAAGGMYAGYRMLGGGGQSADEQNARMQDYLANAQHQMSQPVPSMTVMASYDAFAGEKLAALRKSAEPTNTFQTAHSTMAGAFGTALAQKLVTEPIDNAHRFLRKKIVDDPKAHATFHGVIQEDPMLRDAYAQNPETLEETFRAMRKFGPSMSTSPAVVRSFLRQSTMAGGNMDFATIRLLAETEKFVQNARGRGT